MSRATVRAAIKAFLQPPAVPFLFTVYGAPGSIPATALSGADGVASGAAAFIHFADETEAISDLDGNRRITYTVALQVTFRSRATGTQGTDGDGEAMMADFDALIEGLKSKLRSDHTLGAPSVIWEAAIGDDSETPAIHCAYGLPVRDTSMSLWEIWADVEFPVTEFVPD